MKKLIALLLVLVLSVSLFAACGESGNEETKGSEGTQSTEGEKVPEAKTEYNFYGIYKSAAQYFVNEATATEASLKAWGEANGYTVNWTFLASDSDPEKCLTQVNDAIANKADCIFICVPDQTMSVSVVEACEEAGVLVVAVDDGLIDADGNKIVPWFGIDAYNIGYAAGEWMANYAKDNNLLEDPEAGILYMQMPTVSSCVPRTEGEKAAWEKINGDALSDRTYYADYNADENEAYTNALAVMTANPNITKWLVMTASENGSNAAAAALEDMGLTENSCVNALGGDATVLHWADGNYMVIKSSTYFSGLMVGQLAANSVIAYLEGTAELPLESAVSAEIITPDTYEEFLASLG